jgi:hypothetical protein
MLRMEIVWAEFPWDHPVPDVAGRLPWDPNALGRELRRTHRITGYATLQAMVTAACRRAGVLMQRLGVPDIGSNHEYDLRINLPSTGLVWVSQAFIDHAEHVQLAEAAARVATSEEAALRHIKWWGARYPIGPFFPLDRHLILQQAKLRTSAVLASYQRAAAI